MSSPRRPMSARSAGGAPRGTPGGSSSLAKVIKPFSGPTPVRVQVRISLSPSLPPSFAPY